MDYTTLFLLALGLSADAFAVAITNGIYHYRVSKKECLLTGLTFGLFQGLMPMLGYFLGSTFSDVLHNYHHWVAFFLLGAIGINMVTEAIKERKNPDVVIEAVDIFAPRNLTLQGIATSIDALAAGVSLAVLEINIATSALLIGIITFIFCTLGVYIGKMCGSLLGYRARLFGGFVIIGIGSKIFIENQFLA